MLNEILKRKDVQALADYIVNRYSLIVAIEDVQRFVNWKFGNSGVEELSNERHDTDCCAEVWLCTRLRESGYFRAGPGEMAVPSDVVTAVLHFWPWDEELYGPQPGNEIFVEDPGPSRSRIFAQESRKPHPIDTTAQRVAPEPIDKRLPKGE